MNNKFQKIISYLLVFTLLFSHFSPVMGMIEVNAEESDEVNTEEIDGEMYLHKATLKGLEDLEDNTLKIDVNESKKIILEEDEDHRIAFCDIYGGNNTFAETTFDDNSCTISSFNFGKGYVTIGIQHNEYSDPEIINFYLDSQIDEYVNMVVSDVPNEIHEFNLWDYVKPGVWVNDYYDTCKYDDNNNRICTVEFRYCYSNIDGNEQECVKKEKEITFTSYSGITNNWFYNNYLTLKIDEVYTVSVNNYDGKYEDLIWVSENNDIASVDQNGKITANSLGKTFIKLYDKKTFKYEQVEVNVIEKVEEEKLTIAQFVSEFENKAFTLDINHASNGFSYNYVCNGDDSCMYYPIYKHSVWSYFNKQISNKLDDYYSIYDVNCSDNICNVTLSKYISEDEQEFVEIKNINITLKGLYIISPSYSVNVGDAFNISYANIDAGEVVINYDSDYIDVDENGNYFATKPGKTQIEIISPGYNDIIDLYINYGNTEKQQLSNYMNTLKNIELPYSKSDFTARSDFKYLENLLENKIINEYPGIDIRSMLETEVSCLSNELCNFNLYVKKDYQDLLGNSSVNRIIRINYAGTDDKTINEVKNLDNLIKDIYVVIVDKVIGLEYSCGDTTCFYESLKANTELVNIQSSLGLDINYEIINTFDFKKLVKGGVKYLVSIRNEDGILYTKEVVVNSNHIVTMPSSLDSSGRIDYLKNRIDNLLNVDSTVTLLYDNVYEVNTANKVFNMILDQKDQVKITQVDVTDRIFELSVGGTKQIKYKVWPSNGTVGDIEFVSDNTKIATVDKEGNIKGVSKGHTFIDVKLNNSTSRILVAVGMTVKEVLDSYLYLIDDNIIIQYSDLRYYDDVIQPIQNKISNNFYDTGTWLPLVAKVKVKNGKYYAAVAYNASYIYGADLITSDYKEITYEVEGIKFDKYEYNLTANQVVDTKLFFTEGDNNNLYFSYDRKGVVELGKDGKLKALKPGITTVYVTDKYNKYYNHFTVYVDIDKFFVSVQNKLNTNKIKVNALDYGRYGNFDSVISNELYRLMPFYSLNKATRLDCNEETLKCEFTVYNSNSDDSGIYKQLKFNVEKEGIYLDEFELELDINSEKDISYQLLNDNSNVSIKSLNTDICKIRNNKVLGLAPGLCTIKYTSNKYLNYQHILVGRNQIKENYKNILSLIPNQLEVPLLGFDTNNHNYESDDYLVYSLNYVPISNKIKQILNLDSTYNVWVSYSGNVGESYEDVLVTLSPYFNFEDSKNNYYYYIDLQYNGEYDNENEISRTIDVIPTQIDSDALEIGRKITKQTKDKYTLSMLQYLKLRLSGKMSGLLEYSDFYTMLKKECPTCTLEFGEGGFGGSDDGSYIAEGGGYVIFKDDNPIAILDLSFEATIDVLQNGAVTSEEEFIELLKEIVRDAYIKAREELSTVSRKMSTRSIPSIRLNDDVVVDITSDFDSKLMKNVYTITVDDITFKTVANTETVGDVNYTYSVTDIKLKDKDITLKKGESKVLGYTITPDNATNKKVNFSSSNTKVVTVDKNGSIVAIGVGTTTITISSVDGNVSKKIKVTVKESSTSSVPTKLGDVNIDGKIDMSDLIMLRKYFAGLINLNSQGVKNSDINKDGKVNMTDIIKLRKYFAGLEVI